jgi:hypothetical protein
MLSAHEILSNVYSSATQLLCQEDGDTLRLRIHSERIFTRMIPILEAMEPEISNSEWIAESANALAGVMAQLETATFAAEGVYDFFIFPVTTFFLTVQLVMRVERSCRACTHCQDRTSGPPKKDH